MTDLRTTPIIAHLPSAIEFFERVLLKGGPNESNKLLVHCLAGCSRSVSMVAGYLMFKFNAGFQEVFEYIKQRRKQASPNAGFQWALLQFESVLKNYFKATESRLDPKVKEIIMDQSLSFASKVDGT